VLETPPANASAVFKLVCCRGPCPGGDGVPFVGGDARDYAGVVAGGGGGGGGGSDGASSLGAARDGRDSHDGGRVVESATFVTKLFDIVSDPFDLFDIAGAHPAAVTRMQALLPAGWCGSPQRASL
jgi:hypothetical protein